MGSRERAVRFLLQCPLGFRALHSLEVIRVFPKRFLMVVISVALKKKLKTWHLWWCIQQGEYFVYNQVKQKSSCISGKL